MNYSMSNGLEVANLAAAGMNAWLLQKPETISVQNVEDDPALKEPVFLYRCGDRPSLPPERCYWRLMSEHPSLRIYQLEIQEVS